jgi:nucleotide-binding universal stress UspA family protein
MVTSLLVPLDGSDLAEQVIPFAVRLATSARARIILAHAKEPHIDGHATEFSPSAMAERLRADGIAVDVCMLDVDQGDVGVAVADVAREQQADLVMMSAHGHGGVQRRLFGRVAHQILQAVKLPVLLVPAACRHPWPQDRPLRVLVRLDDAEIAEQILRSAAELAGTLLLVRVIEIPGLAMYSPDYVYTRLDCESDLADASHYLDIVERLRAEGHAIDLLLIVATAALDLARFARGEGVDLIATAFEGGGDTDGLMLGRISTATLQRADMPILLIRPVSVDRMIGSRLPLLESAAARVAPRLMVAGPLVTTTLHSTATLTQR